MPNMVDGSDGRRSGVGGSALRLPPRRQATDAGLHPLGAMEREDGGGVGEQGAGGAEGATAGDLHNSGADEANEQERIQIKGAA
jgi:hypothetical protein